MEHEDKDDDDCYDSKDREDLDKPVEPLFLDLQFLILVVFVLRMEQRILGRGTAGGIFPVSIFRAGDSSCLLVCRTDICPGSSGPLLALAGFRICFPVSCHGGSSGCACCSSPRGLRRPLPDLFPLAAGHGTGLGEILLPDPPDKITIRIIEGAPEVRRQLIHGLIPPVRALFTAFEHDLLHAVGQIRDLFTGTGERILYMLERDSNGGVPLVRDIPSQHLIQSHTQGVDIALFITKSAPRLFGRSVVDRSHYIGSDGIAGGGLRDPEVSHLYLPFLGNNDILGFNVSVDDMVPVSRGKSHGDLDGHSDSLSRRQPFLLFNIALEGDPVYQLHDDEVVSLFLPNVIDIDDIRMHQACSGLGFYPELGNE